MADDDALALPSNLQLLLAEIVTLALDFGIKIGTEMACIRSNQDEDKKNLAMLAKTAGDGGVGYTASGLSVCLFVLVFLH